MKRLFVLLAMVVFLFSIPNFAICEESTGNINLLLGTKHLGGWWEPCEKQGELGALLDYKEESWPFSVAVSYLSSSYKETIGGYASVKVETTELGLGVKKIWEGGPLNLRPYIGIGIALISAELTGSLWGIGISDSDTVPGFWATGGVYLTISESFGIGLECRSSRAEATLFGEETEIGGNHAGLLFGYHW